MSDFNNLCNTFDIMELKYVINEVSTGRQLVIDDQDCIETIGLADPILWFEFDNNGNFKMLYVEE